MVSPGRATARRPGAAHLASSPAQARLVQRPPPSAHPKSVRRAAGCGDSAAAGTPADGCCEHRRGDPQRQRTGVRRMDYRSGLLSAVAADPSTAAAGRRWRGLSRPLFSTGNGLGSAVAERHRGQRAWSGDSVPPMPWCGSRKGSPWKTTERWNWFSARWAGARATNDRHAKEAGGQNQASYQLDPPAGVDPAVAARSARRRPRQAQGQPGPVPLRRRSAPGCCAGPKVRQASVTEALLIIIFIGSCAQPRRSQVGVTAARRGALNHPSNSARVRDRPARTSMPTGYSACRRLHQAKTRWWSCGPRSARV